MTPFAQESLVCRVWGWHCSRDSMEQLGTRAGLEDTAQASMGAGHSGRALTLKLRAWEVFHLPQVSFFHKLMTAGHDEQIKANFNVTLGHNCQASIQETP